MGSDASAGVHDHAEDGLCLLSHRSTCTLSCTHKACKSWVAGLDTHTHTQGVQSVGMWGMSIGSDASSVYMVGQTV
jgi:hypothetical protein